MSDFITTPNYNLRKPTVGADNDKWGGDWNLNADTIDTTMKANANAVAALGTLAQQNANAVAVTGGTIAGLASLGFTTTDRIYPVTSGLSPAIAVIDKWGFLFATANRDGTWSFPAGLSNTPLTLNNPTAASFLYSAAGATVMTFVANIPGVALAVTDQWYLSAWAIASNGTVLSAAAGSSTGGFSSVDITSRTNAALARSQQVKGRVNTTAARPVWKYNHVLWYGQSETLGFAGTPCLTKAQPYDNLMLGGATRPAPYGGTTWVPTTDANLHPLIAVDQSNVGAPVTIKTGTIQNCQGGTFSAGGLITITTGAALTGVFAVGDSFQMQGWTGAANNNDTTYTVAAVTATTIQVNEGFQSVVTTPQNGIGFWQFGGAQYGEDYIVSAMNFWRRQQLDFRGLAADPSRLLIASAAGKVGTAIAPLSKGASPEYFNQLRDVTTKGKAAATAAGGDYGIPAIVFTQGGTDALNGTTYASYSAAFKQMYVDMCADLMPITGQSKQPFYFFYQVSDGTSTDTGDMAIARAQYDCMVSPPSPNWYCVGPSYFTTDWTPHQDSNGYRQMGGMIGKIMHRVIERGEGWMPLYPTAATWRGRQILVDFHVPEPPLQAQPVWNKHLAVNYSDLGFSVLDDAGAVPVASAAIVSDTCVLVIVGRDLSTNPKLRYGDAAHGAGGNLCDSDPTVAEVAYSYTDGSGQGPSANIPALNGKVQPLFNWCCLFSIPMTAG